MQLIHDSLDCSFNFGVQLPDEPNGMLQFQGFDGHLGANGASASIPDFHRHVPPIASSGGICQQSFQPIQMRGSVLLAPRNSDSRA